MLNVRRRREAMRDQLAPFLEIRRAAKIHRMILNDVPADEQAIARRLFDGTAQLHAAAALGAAENRDGLLHALFKFLFRPRFHINLRDFGDHDRSLLVVKSAILFAFAKVSGQLSRNVVMSRGWRTDIPGTVYDAADNTNARDGLHCAAPAG